MKKNLLIIGTIFILPLVGYFMLSNKTNAEQKISTVNVDTPVIIKFSAPMCRDCKVLGENLNKVYPNYEKKIIIQNISVDKNDEATQNMIKKYHVTLVPTLVYIDSDGKILKRTVGSLTSEQLENNMKALINGTLR